ncbi:protein encore isoform X2 [Wyeomyia smithii]|uniref:protein encore isoform X2 n=1 Tax=Wyeomyia smithii TaxID=174621 RepID=UPI002467D7E4|nr:protein encore isoform X2 [Wyeomyia smithii]
MTRNAKKHRKQKVTTTITTKSDRLYPLVSTVLGKRDIFLLLTNKKNNTSKSKQKKSKKNKRSQNMSTAPAQAAIVLSNNNNNNNSSSNIINSSSSSSNNNSIIGTPSAPTTSTPSSSIVSSVSSQALLTAPAAQTSVPASASILTNNSNSNNNNSPISSGCSNSSMATVATVGTVATAMPTAMVPNAVSQVSPPVTATGTNPAAIPSQKEQHTAEDTLNRPNSLGGRQRTLGGKGKHLTRSHAMRESTSPPRTPTPRSPSDQHSNNGSNGSPIQQNTLLSISATSEPQSNNSSSHSPVSESRLFNNNNNDYSSKQPGKHSPNIIVYGGEERGGKSQLDLDFPKLTPPKSSFNPNNGSSNSNSNVNNNNNSGSKNSNGRSNNTGNAAGFAKNDLEKTDHHHSGKIGKTSSDGGINQELKDLKSVGPMLVERTDQQNKSGQAASAGAPAIANATISQSSLSPVSSSNNNYCDNESRNLREVNFSANNNDSNNQLNIHFSHEENRYIQCESPTDSLIRNNSSSNSNLTSSAHSNKKHRAGGGGNGIVAGSGGGSGGGGGTIGGNATGKGSKPRLKNMSGGSSSSADGGSISGGGGGGGGGGSSGFLSRDNSCEQFTDQSGVNLIQFFKETLNKNFKDRNMLIKIEKELQALAMDRSRSQIKFPPMSSYNRMLIHRVAAYFGMEHNVDATQQSVIAEVTPATRIPEIRFKTLINESFSEEPRKSILKRDTHSFDEYRYGMLHCPDRGVLDRKAKSFEEREEEYEKIKRRIFKHREDGGTEEHWQWLSAENADVINGRPKLQNNRLLKVQSVSIDGRPDERPCVSKSHSFGGYGGSSQNAPLLRGDSITSTKSAGARLFSKQDSNASTNTPWRLSPSSSGYKTQSIRSDSVTPSPTGYGSGDHTPEPCVQSPSATCGVVWAVTDMASVPKGSVLIDPQTLQPIVNQDGSIYHFDPFNLPATANLPGSMPRVQKKKFEKQKSFSNRNSALNSSSSLESSIDLPLGKNDCGQQTSTTTTIAEEVGSELNYETTSTVKICSKDNHDLDVENSSLCEEISQTTNELSTLKLQKHQATSPMLQASELQPLELNEVNLNTNHDEHGSLVGALTPIMADPDTAGTLLATLGLSDPTEGNKTNLHPEHVLQHGLTDDGNDASSNNSQDADKKDETGKINVVQPVPLTSYSNSATPNSGYTVNYGDNGSSTPVTGSAMYGSGTPGISTTYQTAPDGTIYAVPSPLVYTYPSTIDPEMTGYFVPVYDQQRDPNLCTTTGASLYPATAGATSSVLPIAYTPTAAYSGAPIYQNHTAVMYSSEQFSAATPASAAAAAAAAAAASAGHLPQYPIGYPIGIGYPFNSTAYQNYWNQPITYYVPQAPVHSSGSTPLLMPPSVSQTPANSAMLASGPAPMPCNTGKRNTTPPSHGGHQSQNQNQSSSVTPVPISPFATNIPVPLPDPTTGPMYAIPQPIYSNMLPFAGPMTPHPHHPATGGTIVNSILPTATAAASTGYHPHSQSNQGNPESLPSSNGSSNNIYSSTGNNNALTPQSTPSTPLSLPLSMPPHAKNPPLFATPPMLPNGYAPQLSSSGAGSGGAGHYHYGVNSTGGHNYDERKGSGGSGGGYQGKRSNQNGSNFFSYNSNNSRQMTPNSGGYQGTGCPQSQNTGSNGPKNSSYACNTNNTGNNQNSNNNGNGPQMLGQPPKGQPRSDGQTSVTKPPLIPTLPNSTNNTTSNTNPSDKTRINRSCKPPNLDLKRNFNNFNANSRNTPSTNSTESNNSPNSITSSSMHEHHQQQQQQQQHHVHHHTQPHHQPAHAAGSGQPHHPYYPPQHQQQQPHYYSTRGGSVGSNNGGSSLSGNGSGSGNGSNHAHQTANAAAATAAAAAAAAAHTVPSSALQSAAAVAAAACAAAIEPYHSQLIPLNAAGMSYVKIGQTYFTHPSLALPPNRRSPPNEIRPIAGVYPAMNMVMPASRQYTPRPQHSSSFHKGGSKAPR